MQPANTRRKGEDVRPSSNIDLKPEGLGRSFESPIDGENILITFEGHRSHWSGPYVYRRKAAESNNREHAFGACFYGDDWQRRGELAYTFEEVEFWSRWEGESSEEYEARKQKIIADRLRRGQKVDPLEAFVGANSIRGSWTPPKVGPAFEPQLKGGHWSRPNDGQMVQVFVNGSTQPQVGRYLAAADMIHSVERLVVKRQATVQIMDSSIFNGLLRGEKIPGAAFDTQFGDGFRFGPPQHPFSEWERYRILSPNVTSDQEISIEGLILWIDGPRAEDWRERMEKAVREREISTFGGWSAQLEADLRDASGTAERIVILRRQLRKEMCEETENRSRYVDALQTKLDYFQEVLSVERGKDVATPSTSKIDSKLNGVVQGSKGHPLAFEHACPIDDAEGINRDLMTCQLVQVQDHSGSQIAVWMGSMSELGHIVEFLIQNEIVNNPVEYEKLAAGLYTREFKELTGRRIKKCRENAKYASSPTSKVSRARKMLGKRFASKDPLSDIPQ